jgi:hypothetical protein
LRVLERRVQTMSEATAITLIGYGITFILGLASGFAIETLRFKYLRKKDNWNDLRSPLQDIYIVVRNICNDADHAFKIHDNSSRSVLDTVFERINRNLRIYLKWFKSFEGKLGIEKVNSIDEELGAALKGISYYAIYSEQNPIYVETKLFRFIEITSSAESRLREFSKANIPHYVLFGKRKLENWRTSQF